MAQKLYMRRDITSAAVFLAAKRIEHLLKTGNEALDGVRTKLEAGQYELEVMRRTLKEAAEKYSHDPTVKKLLSKIKKCACQIEDTIDDSDFEELMIRRRSVIERMLLVFSCNVDKNKDRLIYVLKNIEEIRVAFVALVLRYKWMALQQF